MNTPEAPALTIPEFAAAYGLKESWVRVAVRPGNALADLHHRVGKHVRFTEADCLGFEARTAAGNHEPKPATDDLPADGDALAGLTPDDVHRSITRLAKALPAAA